MGFSRESRTPRGNDLNNIDLVARVTREYHIFDGKWGVYHSQINKNAANVPENLEFQPTLKARVRNAIV